MIVPQIPCHLSSEKLCCHPRPRSVLHSRLLDTRVRPRHWVSGLDKPVVLFTFWNLLQGWQRWVFRSPPGFPRFLSLFTKKLPSEESHRLPRRHPVFAATQGLTRGHTACLQRFGLLRIPGPFSRFLPAPGCLESWKEIKKVKSGQMKSLPSLTVYTNGVLV